MFNNIYYKIFICCIINCVILINLNKMILILYIIKMYYRFDNL